MNVHKYVQEVTEMATKVLFMNVEQIGVMRIAHERAVNIGSMASIKNAIGYFTI